MQSTGGKPPVYLNERRPEPMIVEERIYRCKPAKVLEFFRIYEEEVMQIQLPILGRMVGYFTTECGPLNQIVHMWAFDDFADRELRRARLAADEGWQRVSAKLHPLIDTMENKILIPAPFSALGGEDGRRLLRWDFSGMED